MRRPTRLALLVAAAGLIVPTAVTSTPASAVDQDLTLTATSGAAGLEVTASSASCPIAETDGGLGYLTVRLISGTGTDAVLAGVALAIDDQPATFVIPDWIDPTDDAVVEAACVTVDITGGEPTFDEFAYDPIAFDVEASGGSPVQARTYSRTSLLAGQAFQVDGSGCFLTNASEAFTDVASGNDPSFRTATDFIAGGGGEVTGGTFSVPVGLSNGGLGVGISQVDDEPPTVDEIDEQATDIPAGTYTSISYCSNEAGVNLVFPPQLIEVTGDAPFGDVDLTVPAESRTATLAGGSCTAGEVNFELYPTDITASAGLPILDPQVDAVRAESPAALAGLRGPAGTRTVTQPDDAWARSLGASTTRALVDGEPVEGVAVPDDAGNWSASDEATFDDGVIEASSWCGDPLADGFIYDPQGAAVAISPVAPTVPVTAPTPQPANAVSGTPTYAG